jgi:flavin-dependent dehydrogenase
MEKLVIVGGGVAGLSCLNALLDRGVSPLLLDGSWIGSPKMCGEFIAPPAVEQLTQWGLGPMCEVKQAYFLSGKKQALHVPFRRPAAAFSRHLAEIGLAARARRKGGRVLESSPIQTITPATANSPYVLHLASGENLVTEDVIFATGKFSSLNPPKGAPLYVGFKTHIQQIIQHQTLMMLSVKGGYLGIVPISSEKSNLTCLIRKDALEQAGGKEAFLNNLVRKGSLMQRLAPFDLSALEWLEGEVRAFGLRTCPKWPRAYWIGDAWASFYPAIGYGFAHGVNSAILAADCYLQHDNQRYDQAMKQPLRARLAISQWMHRVLQKPGLCDALAPVIAANPWMSHVLLKKLDY